jgi:hypothetical protein
MDSVSIRDFLLKDADSSPEINREIIKEEESKDFFKINDSFISGERSPLKQDDEGFFSDP